MTDLLIEIRYYHIYRAVLILLFAMPFFILSTILAIGFIIFMDGATTMLFGEYHDDLNATPASDAFWSITESLGFMIQLGMPFALGFLISGLVIKDKK